MIEPPHLIELPARLTAIIRLTVPREQIQQVMDHNIQELLVAFAEQGVAPSGPLFTHHLRIDPKIFDFELGFPVTTAVAPTETGVLPSEWPAMKVARTVYQGSYEGLAAAWGEFHAWIAANGHAPTIDLWQSFLYGPESNPTDPSTWRTALIRPLRD